VIDEIRRRHRAVVGRGGLEFNLWHLPRSSPEVVLAQPTTYMNHSGAAVAAMLDRFDRGPEDLAVICDDLYLGLGTIRLRPRGSAGGHRGLGSIIEALGTADFPRLRMGIGPAGAEVEHAEFVLQPFPLASRPAVTEMIRRAADCAEMIISAGLGQAMSHFNRRASCEDVNEGAEP
jgi:PTH1 family peptidyl-tRNA hydrolase